MSNVKFQVGYCDTCEAATHHLIVNGEVKCRDCSRRHDGKTQLRSFNIDTRLISCANCQCNYPHYDASHPVMESGEWCQVWSFPLDPMDLPACEKRASTCMDWIPRKFSRSHVSAVGAVNPERWYEKDSMA